MIKQSYISDYNKAGRSSSEGVNTIFYSKNIDLSRIKNIEKMLRKEDSYIYDKYLKRFEV